METKSDKKKKLTHSFILKQVLQIIVSLVIYF